mmetsp:Transcript_29054/g.61837  ORF Transcript_29054/g.61837 Transcript_29054/m.61837 type:complete len:127 (+) Transcript_29054:1921-2301(+)
MVTTDCNTAIIALWALKNILKVGKKEAKPSKLIWTYSSSSNVQMIESKLEELTSENVRFEHETKCVKLLQKKKAWLEFDAQNEHVETLSTAAEFLKEQKRQAQQHLLPIFRNKIASVDTGTPVGQV